MGAKPPSGANGHPYPGSELGIADDLVGRQCTSARPAAVQTLGYAQSNDIHLAPGRERHLPHEVGHVVQKRRGGVPLADVPINR